MDIVDQELRDGFSSETTLGLSSTRRVFVLSHTPQQWRTAHPIECRLSTRRGRIVEHQ